MATDITGYLLLEKDSSPDFIGGRDITHIVQLDEGHDRPVWQWVKLNSERLPRQANVPSGVDDILLEGIRFLAAKGKPIEFDHDTAIHRVLQNQTLTVVVFEDSSLIAQLPMLVRLGLNYRVLKQD